MWFGGNERESFTESGNDQENFENSHEAVESIFKSNMCYELLPTSCKVLTIFCC